MSTAGDHEHDQGPDWTDETVAWYAREYGEWASNRMTVAAIEWRPDDIVVDVGCGTGCALRHAVEHVTEGRLVGVDPVPGMIRIARQQTTDHPAQERIELLECGADALQLDDALVTVAMSINSLHHWDDIAGGLAELMRVLVPAGRLYVAEDHDIQEMHGWRADDVQAALATAGFVEGSVRVLTEDEVVLDLHHARKPAR